MNVWDTTFYQNEVATGVSLLSEYTSFRDCTILISGSTGMIGSYLIDLIMKKNETEKSNITIIALGRNSAKAKNRFERYWSSPFFLFFEQDINSEIKVNYSSKIDYIVHAASNTHPVAYSTDPIGTIMTNILGTKNLLDYGVSKNIKRFVFLSSVEIYGENRNDTEKFEEEYMGYIDCNSLRAGYPEGKRSGEALCQAYRKQYSLDIVIARLARTYGPTLLKNDTKAMSQFIKKGVNKEDIVLKSEGNQLYSYTHVLDAVTGLICILFKGTDGEAYNVADDQSNITLKNIAKIISHYVGTNIVFELPNSEEKLGFSKSTKALMDSKKINAIGWRAYYSIENGLKETINILKSDKVN